MTDPRKRSQFSKVIDGATYVPTVGFSWVVLQFDLPVTSTGLHDLFSLQLLARRERLTDLLTAQPGDARTLQLNRHALRFVDPHTCLSAIVVAGQRHELDHFAYPLELDTNCLLRDISIEQLPFSSEPWLIRGTLVSGSIKILEPEQVFHQARELRELLWPAAAADSLTGIFLSGEQFQIEIDSPNEPDLLKRMQFVAATRDQDENVNGILWRMVNPIMPEAGLTYVDPDAHLEQQIDELKQAIAKATSRAKTARSKEIVVESAGAQPELLAFVSADGPIYRRQFVRPGISLVFKNGFGQTTTWRPGTLYQTDDGFQLVDTDEVQYVIENARTSLRPKRDRADLITRWSSDAPATVTDVRDTVLTAPGSAGEGTRPVIWQLAHFGPRNEAHSSWIDQPPSWVRYNIAPPPLTPRDTGGAEQRLAGVTSDFRFLIGNGVTNNRWIVRADVERNVPTHLLGPSPTRMALDIDENAESAELQLYAAKLSVQSPQSNVYLQSMNDPNFIPLERGLDLSSERYGPERLVFAADPINRPVPIGDKEKEERERSTDAPTAVLDTIKLTGLSNAGVTEINNIDGLFSPASVGSLIEISGGTNAFPGIYTIVAFDEDNNRAIVDRDWNDGVAATTDGIAKLRRFSIRSSAGHVTAYMPASRALVDPVSPAAGNITATQIVSMPVFTHLLTITDINFDPNKSQTIIQVTGAPLPSKLDDYEGFFAVWHDPENNEKPVITRIAGQREVNASNDRIRLDGQPELAVSTQYILEIGPTRLALPRDPTHGLIAVELRNITEFSINDPSASGPRTSLLAYDPVEVAGADSSSVLALHPWSEWGPDAKEWLQTGRIRQHHRNLIQEHAEFESSFEDRFPPEGPPARDNGSIPTPLLPYADFIRAVRDRYTQASGNIFVELHYLVLEGSPGESDTYQLSYKGFVTANIPITHTADQLRTALGASSDGSTTLGVENVRVSGDLSTDGLIIQFLGKLAKPRADINIDNSGMTGGAAVVSKLPHEKQIKNWLPGASIKSNLGNDIDSAFSFTESSSDPFPETALTWSEGLSQQSLKVRKPEDPLSARHWLEYEVEPKKLEVGSKPELVLSDPTSRPNPNQRRVVNSSAPLLLNNRALQQVAYVQVGSDQYAIQIKSPSGTAFLWRSNGSPIAVPGGSITAIDAVLANNVVHVAVGRSDGSCDFYRLSGNALVQISPTGTAGDNIAGPNPDYRTDLGPVTSINLGALDRDPHLFAAVAYQNLTSGGKVFLVRYDDCDSEWKRETLTLPARHQSAYAQVLAVDADSNSTSDSDMHVAAGLSDGHYVYYFHTAIRDEDSAPQQLSILIHGKLNLHSGGNINNRVIELEQFSYDISAGTTVDLFWGSGQERLGVQIGPGSGLAIPVSGGSRDDLPPGADPIQIRIMRPINAIAIRREHDDDYVRIWRSFGTGELFQRQFRISTAERLGSSVQVPSPIRSITATNINNINERTDQTGQSPVYVMVGCDDGRGRVLLSHPRRGLSAAAANSPERTFEVGDQVLGVDSDRLPYDQRTSQNLPSRIVLASADGNVRVFDVRSGHDQIIDNRGRNLLPQPRSIDELADASGLDLDKPTVYDNLGTARRLRHDRKPAGTGQWLIEELHVDNQHAGIQNLQSISTAGFVVADNTVAIHGDTVNAQAITDIRFSCESIKVSAESLTVGELDESLFADGPTYGGCYGFFSDITAYEDNSLRIVNHWPRVGGVPVFVTRLTKLQLERVTFNDLERVSVDSNPVRTTLRSAVGGFTAVMVGSDLQLEGGTNAKPGIYRIRQFIDDYRIVVDGHCEEGSRLTSGTGSIDYPIALEFEAVIVNPDEIAAGVDEESERHDIKGFVRSAVARGSVALFTVDFTKSMDDPERLSIETDSEVDWLFALNRQTQLPDPDRGFEGRLARVVSKTPEIEDGRIKLPIIAIESEASLLGRLWKLDDDRLPTLAGNGYFVRNGTVWQQTECLFREEFDEPTSYTDEDEVVFHSFVDDPVIAAGWDKGLTLPEADEDEILHAEAIRLNGVVIGDRAGVMHRKTGLVDQLPPGRSLALSRLHTTLAGGRRRLMSSGDFTADMEGHSIELVSGANVIPGIYRIKTFHDPSSVDLDGDCCLAGKELGDGIGTVVLRATSSDLLTVRDHATDPGRLLRYHVVAHQSLAGNSNIQVLQSDVEKLAVDGLFEVAEELLAGTISSAAGDQALVRLATRPTTRGTIERFIRRGTVLRLRSVGNPLVDGDAITINRNSYVAFDSRENSDDFSVGIVPEEALQQDYENATDLWNQAQLIEHYDDTTDPPTVTSTAHRLADGTAITLFRRDTGADFGTFQTIAVSRDQLNLLSNTNGNGNWTPGSGTWSSGGLSGNVEGASNASPIVITATQHTTSTGTTGTGHGLNTGDRVAITGVNGNTAANSTGDDWHALKITDDSFALLQAAVPSNCAGLLWAPRKPIDSIQSTAPYLVTARAHGLQTGDWFDIDLVDGSPNLYSGPSPRVSIIGKARRVIFHGLDSFFVVMPRKPDGTTPDPAKVFWRRMHRLVQVSSGGATDPMVAHSRHPHKISNGTLVQLEGLTGAGAPNGTFVAFEGSSINHFELRHAQESSGAVGTGGTFDRGRPIDTASNSTPIRILTPAEHGLTTGDEVTITGVTGNDNANGTFRVIVVADQEFDLYKPHIGAGNFSGGTWEDPGVQHPVAAIQDRTPTTLELSTAHELPNDSDGNLVRTLGTGLGGINDISWIAFDAGDHALQLWAENTTSINYRGGAVWNKIEVVAEIDVGTEQDPILQITNKGGSHGLINGNRVLLRNSAGEVLQPNVRLRAKRILLRDELFLAYAEVEAEFPLYDPTWVLPAETQMVAASYPSTPGNRQIYQRLIDDRDFGLPSTNSQTNPITELQVTYLQSHLVALTIDGTDVKVWHLARARRSGHRAQADPVAVLAAGSAIHSVSHLLLRDGSLLVGVTCGTAPTGTTPYELRLWRLRFESAGLVARDLGSHNPYGTTPGPFSVSLASSRPRTVLKCLTPLTGLRSDEGTKVTSSPAQFSPEMKGQQIQLVSGTNARPGYYRITKVINNSEILIDRPCDDGNGDLSGGAGNVIGESHSEEVAFAAQVTLTGLFTASETTETLESAFHSFTREMEEYELQISGTNAEPDVYQIESYSGSQSVELDRPVSTTGGGLANGTAVRSTVELFTFDLHEAVSLGKLTATQGDTTLTCADDVFVPDMETRTFELIGGTNAEAGKYTVDDFLSPKSVELNSHCDDGNGDLTGGIGAIHPTITRRWRFDVPADTEDFQLQGTQLGLRLLTYGDDEARVQTLVRVLRISSRQDHAPEFHLPVELGSSPADALRLSVEITRARQIELRYEPEPKIVVRAIAQFQQGIHRCFVGMPTSTFFGQDALVIWPEGDLEDVHLGVIFLATDAVKSATARIAIRSLPDHVVTGPLVRIDALAGRSNSDEWYRSRLESRVLTSDSPTFADNLTLLLESSSPATKVNDPFTPLASGSMIIRDALVDPPITDLRTIDTDQLVLASASDPFHFEMVGNEIVILSGTNAKPGVYQIVGFDDRTRQVTLDRSCSDGNGAVTGGSGRLIYQTQIPARFHVDDALTPNPKLSLVEDTCWVNAITPARGSAESQNVTCLQSSFVALETSRKSLDTFHEVERFVRPEIGIASSQIRLVLKEVSESDVPLDLNLETGALRKVPRQSSDTVQVTHRVGFGSRLRYTIPLQNYLSQQPTPGANLSLKDHLQWMLRPIVNDGNRIQLLTENLWVKKATFQDGVRLATESLINLFRPRPNHLFDLRYGHGATPAAFEMNIKRVLARVTIRLTQNEGEIERLLPQHFNPSVSGGPLNSNVVRIKFAGVPAGLTLESEDPAVAQVTGSSPDFVIRKTPSVPGSPEEFKLKISSVEVISICLDQLTAEKIEVALPADLAPVVTGGPLQTAPVRIRFQQTITPLELSTNLSALVSVSQIQDEFIAAVDNATIPESQLHSFNEDRLKDLLNKKGAAGVALIRRLDDNGKSHLRFVRSPFFDHAGGATEADLLQESITSPENDRFVYSVRFSGDVLHTIDYRLLRPAEARQRTRIESSYRYLIGEPQEELFRSSPCTPMREVRYRRASPVDDNGNPIPDRFGAEPGSDQPLPHPALRALEATAFRQMKSLAFLPQNERRFSSSSSDPADDDHLFLPRTIDVRCAIDKPGATFHELIQARVGRSDQDRWSWTIEPVTHFVRREPQHVSVRDCVTASVILKMDVFTVDLSVNGTPGSTDTFDLIVDVTPGRTATLPHDSDNNTLRTKLENELKLDKDSLTLSGGPLPTAVTIQYSALSPLAVDNTNMTGGSAAVLRNDNQQIENLDFKRVPLEKLTSQALALSDSSLGSGKSLQITFDRASTSPLEDGATSAEIKDALVGEDMPLFASDVDVSDGVLGTNEIKVELTGALAHSQQPLSGTTTSSGFTVTPIAGGREVTSVADFAHLTFTWDEVLGEVDIVQGVNEIQELTLTPEGTCELTFEGESAVISATASGAEIEASLRKLTAFRDNSIQVSGGYPEPIRFEFVGSRAKSNQTDFIFDASDLKRATASIDIDDGGSSKNEIQTLTITPSPITLSFGSDSHTFTTFPVTASAIQQELDGWTAFSSDQCIRATGGPLPNEPIQFEFIRSRGSSPQSMFEVTPQPPATVRRVKAGSTGLVLSASGGLIDIENPPLQLIVQFNQDLFDILPSDQALPANKLEKNEGSENKEPALVPAKTYVVSKVDNLEKYRVISDLSGTVRFANGNPLSVRLNILADGSLYDVNPNGDDVTEGIVTMTSSSHELKVGMTVTITWSGGASSRKEAKVTNVDTETNRVTFSSGTGNDLPATSTAMVLHEEIPASELPLDGDKLAFERVVVSGELTAGSGNARDADVESGHKLQTGMTVTLKWDTGSRQNVTLGTVTDTSIPFTGGSGDTLPNARTELTIVEVPVPPHDTLVAHDLWRVARSSTFDEKKNAEYLLFRDSVTTGRYTNSPNAWWTSEKSISITNATRGNPVEITTSTPHHLVDNELVTLESVGGMTELNRLDPYRVAVEDATTFRLSGVDGTTYSPYTSGGEVKLSGQIDQASNESPVVIKSQSEHRLESGDTVTITDTDGNRPVASGSGWHVLVLSELDFVLLRDVTGSGSLTTTRSWHRIQSKVRPYFQASPVRKDEVQGSMTNGEGPIEIQNTDGNLRHNDNIRIATVKDEKALLAIGDWCLIEPSTVGPLDLSGDHPTVTVPDGRVVDNNSVVNIRWNGGSRKTTVARSGNTITLTNVPHSELPGAGTTIAIPKNGGKLLLHRNSFGNGDYITGGTVTTTDGAIESVTNRSPMVVTTDTAHGLGDGDEVTISGVQGNTAANGVDWSVRIVDDTSFELYHPSLAGELTNTATIDVSYLRINSFGKALGDTEVPPSDVRPFLPALTEGNVTAWTLRPNLDPARELDWQSDDDRPLLQFTWAGRLDVLSEDNLVSRGAFGDVYEEPKQIKFLNPCLLSPKLAAVVVMNHQSPLPEDKLFAMQRDVLFGDSAPATKGEPELNDDDPDRTVFRFIIKDNRESVKFGLPDEEAMTRPPKADLYLVKYLITGATIYDEIKGIRLK